MAKDPICGQIVNKKDDLKFTKKIRTFIFAAEVVLESLQKNIVMLIARRLAVHQLKK